MYTPAEALEAIKARIAGEWDNPQLVRLGALLPETLEDIGRIIEETLIEPVTKVLFLKEDVANDILAIFPEQVEKNNHFACYSHNGQHTSASKGYAMMLKEASKKEYKHLLTELNAQGYNLEVLNSTSYKL